MLNPYGAAAVGEVGDAQRGLEIMAEYTSGGDKVQMCYPFEMLQPKRLTAGLLAETFARMEAKAPDAWPCWAYSNHDVVRHITRWNLSDAGARAYTVLLMCLRGSLCLYQGEELGLPEAELDFDELQDPYGIEFWPEFKGRDGCRTPMVWTTDNAAAGFTTGRPWLPVKAPHRPLSVAAQQTGDTMLNHYRRALAFRRTHASLRTGAMTGIAAEGAVARFLRQGDETIFCAFNLAEAPATVALPEGRWEQLGTELGSTAPSASVTLPGWVSCWRNGSREGTMADLLLKNVEKAYGEVKVLKNINLDIKTGELIVFVGPSGCGKSTLLRMIAGLEKITAGDFTIDGVRMNDVPPAQRGIAMVFQSYALYPHMTVRENMSFALKIAKKSPAEIEAAVDKAAKILQLTPYLDRLPKALSGGQRQRVAIGRSIVRDPKVYLFDEPLSNLDAALRVATRIEIAQLKEAMPQSTMIYVTHDQVEAMTLASRIVVLTVGQGIGQVGTPLELYERPENEFVAQFIGSPAMNLMPGEITGTGATTTISLAGGGTATAAIPTQAADKGLKVNVGVRPEDFIPTDGAPIYTGKVEITEALGEVTQLYFEKNGRDSPVIAKLPGIHPQLRHQTVKLTADPKKVHLFSNGRSLLYR